MHVCYNFTMFLLLFIVKFLIIFQETNCEKITDIQFIKQYIDNQVSKLFVNNFLCWNRDDLQLLAQNLNQNYMMNIQTINLDNPQFYKKDNNIYILDLNCENSTILLLSANKLLHFKEQNHWLLLQDQNISNNKNPENIFHKIDIFIDSKVVLAQKLGNIYTLEYVYKMDKNSKIFYDNFASWNNKNGFTRFENNAISWRRHNLGLHPIRIATVITNNASYDHMDDYRYNEIDTPTKLNYILSNSLLDYLNATRHYKYHTTWYNIKTKNQNGTLIGSVLNREIEITGTPFFCKPERLPWMDCIAMTTPAEGFFIFRQPPLSYVKNIYILPFETELWLTNISFLFLSALFLYIVILWEWKILIENIETPESDMIHATFSDSLLFTMGAVCQQGYATEPKGAPGKMLMLTIFISLIFIFTAYTAYTVVLFQETADDIKTLLDLYESDIVLGLEDKPYYRELFPKYTEPLRKKIYQEKIIPKGQTPRYYSLQEGMEKIRNEYFAFHTDYMSSYKVIHDTFLETEKCGLKQIGYLYENNPYIVSPKNLPFKELFKIGYRKLLDSGLYRRELKKRIAHKPECNSQGNNFRSAGILDLYSIYILLLMGVISSLLMLLCEILIYKFTAQYKFSPNNMFQINN